LCRVFPSENCIDSMKQAYAMAKGAIRSQP
jgi:hypothetical protein